jgi:uncharacterized protein (TIGR04255 family)
MTTDENTDRQLSRNSIELFIIRFDLQPTKEEDYQSLLSAVSKYFDRVEKRTQTNFEVKFTSDKSEVNKVEAFDHVLINDEKGYSMTFSSAQNSFWFETKNYIDRKTYSDVIDELISSTITKKINLSTRRIGMRFVNNFKSDKLKNASKIFNAGIAKSIIQRASQENISRVICVEEFTYDQFKVRVQFGIPNKFYPAVLNNYDLLLDIDAFDSTIQTIDKWSEIINNLNHSAYKAFVANINPNYLNSLK